MDGFTVRNGAWVVIGDGKKALVLHNAGDAELINLRRVSVREQGGPATQDEGNDVAGRTADTVNGRGGSTETDWHELDETRFADALADDINAAAREHRFKELVVIAPPKTLAELRREWTKETEKLIVAEIAKDYTHHPIPEIERLLATHRPTPPAV